MVHIFLFVDVAQVATSQFFCSCLFQVVDMSRLYIGRLSDSARERDVERFFKGYGRLREIVLKNGYGFVVRKNKLTLLDFSAVGWFPVEYNNPVQKVLDTAYMCSTYFCVDIH
jgi:RNA recognition motif-containing protein